MSASAVPGPTDPVTSQGPEIIEFILAQIAEEEAEARKRLHHAQQNDLTVRDPAHLGKFMPGWYEWREIEVFAARVLAGCAAKRRIVEMHDQGGVRWVGFPRADHQETYCLADQHPTPCPTLRALASVYVEHPDYKEEWT